MIVIKFRIAPDPNGCFFVNVFAGDRDQTLQSAGRLLLRQEEWELLRRALAYDAQRLIVEESANESI